MSGHHHLSFVDGCHRCDLSRDEAAEPRPLKDERSCCLSRRDALGRLPIGFCSDDCEGRR